MAMTMKGEVELPANRDVVWAKLNDPEVLKTCIPGCQSLDSKRRGREQSLPMMYKRKSAGRSRSLVLELSTV
jgi:uncharacterized protein